MAKPVSQADRPPPSSLNNSAKVSIIPDRRLSTNYCIQGLLVNGCCLNDLTVGDYTGPTSVKILSSVRCSRSPFTELIPARYCKSTAAYEDRLAQVGGVRKRHGGGRERLQRGGETLPALQQPSVQLYSQLVPFWL
jgi:hypothetical protein